MMQDITLKATGEIAEYINRKGFAEVFIRTVQGKCSEIAKCAIAVSPEKSKEITKIAVNATQQLGVTGKDLSNFKTDLLHQINPQEIRRNLASLSKTQMQNSALLKNMSQNVNSIYSVVSSVQAISWLNAALSIANIATTIISTVVICKKLNEINEKLDVISIQLENVDKKISSLKRIQFETSIAKPCRDLVRDYKVIIDEFENDIPVSKNKMISMINNCCSQIETIINLRSEYDMNDMLLLLYDLVPVYTDLIIRFYQQYYDPKKPQYALHDDWMKVFSLLSCEGFRNDIRDYYCISRRKNNKELNEIMDCQYLVTIGAQQKIEQVLSDLSKCDSPSDYRDICRLSEQYALQQAKAMKAEMESKFGSEETEEMIEPVKMMYLYAEAE